jgi:hypothetical protein
MPCYGVKRWRCPNVPVVSFNEFFCLSLQVRTFNLPVYSHPSSLSLKHKPFSFPKQASSPNHYKPRNQSHWNLSSTTNRLPQPLPLLHISILPIKPLEILHLRLPTWPVGTFPAMSLNIPFFASSGIPFHNSVSTAPGLTTLTLTGFKSIAKFLAIPCKPAEKLATTLHPGIGFSATLPAVKMILLSAVLFLR